MSDYLLRAQLRRLAGELLKRPITDRELDRLVESILRSPPRSREDSLERFSRATGVSKELLREAANTDDADRIITDIINLLD